MTARSHLDPATSQVWLVGGGVASMAAAVFLIRDAGMPAGHIHILEELGVAAVRSTAPSRRFRPASSRAAAGCSKRKPTRRCGTC